MRFPLKLSTLAATIAVGTTLSIAACSKTETTATASLSPVSWGESEVAKYDKLLHKTLKGSEATPEAVGEHGAISATYSAPAMRAGLEALKQGGTAADAVATTAITQVALSGGFWVSYSGIFNMVYYDAATDKVYDLNASYNTVQADKDAGSIPATTGLANWRTAEPVANGRATLVPGFLKGVEAANQRFGKLPFKELFAPAIYYTERGIPVTPYFEKWIVDREAKLKRRPESRELFFKEGGEPLRVGDTFVQTKLNDFVRNVAEKGSDYMYKGEWAEKFVARVQEEGGLMTTQDLADYQVTWGDPVVGQFRDYTIYGHGTQAFGGVAIINALKLYEASGLKENGYYADSAETMYWLDKIGQLSQNISMLPPETLKAIVKGEPLDNSREALTSDEGNQKIWQKMSNGDIAIVKLPTNDTKHSDAIVAVDQYGNWAAVVHSVNALGDNGAYVDGVSLNNSGAIQQAAVAAAGPGNRLPDPTNPTLIFKGGKPFLASTSMSPALHAKTLFSLINVLDYNKSPKEAIESPYLPMPNYDWATMSIKSNNVIEGQYSDEVLAELDKMGMPTKVISLKESRFVQGLWAGIKRGADGKLYAGAPDVTDGQALAY